MKPLRKSLYEYESDPIEHSGEDFETQINNAIAKNLFICMCIGLATALVLVVGGFYLFG